MYEDISNVVVVITNRPPLVVFRLLLASTQTKTKKTTRSRDDEMTSYSPDHRLHHHQISEAVALLFC